MVIWLIGISGAGKTTLGNRLKKLLDEKQVPSFLIDGDIVRNFFENDLGYTVEDRRANIKRIMLAAHVLDAAGIIAVVCNIHPFEELRSLARRKIKEYHEVYLKHDVASSQAEDVKGMYLDHLGKTDIVGIDFEFETPLHCDLTLNTSAENEEESFARLVNYLAAVRPEVFL